MRLRFFRGRIWQPRRALGSHRRAARPDQAPPASAIPSLRPSPGRPPAQSGSAAGYPGPAAGDSRHVGFQAAGTRSAAVARAAVRTAPATARGVAAAPARAAATVGRPAAAARADDGQPWYAVSRAAPGFRHCGCLEDVLIREWAVGADPGPAAVTAINRLAELPLLVKQKLATGLDAIHVGPGGVPDLDDMGALKGVALPSGRATWDACAGAYGDRKIVIGSRPSPAADVTCHEVGHALDDLDGAPGQWQSDSAAFHALYRRCVPHAASEFHRRGGSLGRREFFADAFAAIASRQRPALVEMLSGDTRTALDVMLYFNVRYGI